VIHTRACVKINLCLEVLGRRADGYHEVTTILQTIDWADELVVEAAVDLSFSCDDPALDTDENLAFQAARLLRKYAGVRQGARITLQKKVPVAAGLGGGSSDAAAALQALNRLWDLGLPPGTVERLAAELGSDVPFFLRGGTALAQGRGERLTPLPPQPMAWVLLLVPPLQIPEKTRHLYSLLRENSFSSGDTVHRWADALRVGWDGEGMPPSVNTFERVADRAFPDLERYRQALRDSGGKDIRISGAGPALFTIPPSEEQARRIAGNVQRMEGVAVRVCQTVGPI
jgi:4-diphosphocytidyl-2-C-methyl-D-erythritol kinase